jgi:hypothetical protein
VNYAIEETFHARLVGPHGPSVCVSKDLIMLEQWVKNCLVREVDKTIFIVQVKEKVLKQVPAKLI